MTDQRAPQDFTVPQLKQKLKNRGLQTSGNKAELQLRLKEADPDDNWVYEEDAVEQYNMDEQPTNDSQGQAILPQRDVSHDDYVREIEFMRRERLLMERELNIMRRENELLRNTSSTSDGFERTARSNVNVKAIGDLLNEFSGVDCNFEQWAQQLRLLSRSYDLDDNTAKILIGPRLRGKAQSWFYSKPELLQMGLEEVLEQMKAMYDYRPSKIDLRKQFEKRTWQAAESFHDHYHDKLIKANRASIPADEIMDYVIDGISDYHLRNQARMQNFPSMSELLQSFKKITLRADTTSRSRRKAVFPTMADQQVGPAAPPRVDMGICNNLGFIQNYLTENILTRELYLQGFNIYPFVAPYHNEYLISIGKVYSELRYLTTRPNAPAYRKAIYIGEIITAGLNLQKGPNPITCRQHIAYYIQNGIIEDHIAHLGDYDNAMYANFKLLNDVIDHYQVGDFFQRWPPTAEQLDGITAQQVATTLYFLGYGLRDNRRQLAIDAIAHSYCALSKRGQVTEDFCLKISNSIRDELGVNINLSAATLNALYKGYMTTINETNAHVMFEYLDGLVPDLALRIKLTLNQSAGSGLTLFTIIGRAIRKYPGFDWIRADRLTGGELQSWNQATEIIGNNIYYGFRRDMGQARSTLYKSIGYIAKELLVKINGEGTLNRYAGLGGNIKNKLILDRMITAFVNDYGAQEGVALEIPDWWGPRLEAVQQNELFA